MPWLTEDLSPDVSLTRHDYAYALRLSLLFYRAQRSGDLVGTDNPIPYRATPSFTTDGADVGVDLSKGYFDAGDYVKYSQPASYTLTMLAWGGLEFERGYRRIGEASELRAAVRWGADYILAAATHLETNCTFYAQVGRGSTKNCASPGCKFDHGFWGRPEDYGNYRFSHQRQTYTIDASRPATEAYAGAAAALASAYLLLRSHDEVAYTDELLEFARRLYTCATTTNPTGEKLTAFLPEAYPQYQSRSVVSGVIVLSSPSLLTTLAPTAVRVTSWRGRRFGSLTRPESTTDTSRPCDRTSPSAATRCRTRALA